MPMRKYWNGMAAATGTSNGSTSAPPLITGVAVNTAGGRFSLPTLVRDQLARVPGLQNAPTSTGIVGVALNQNLQCSNGGSATLFASIADPNFMVLSVGDILSIGFFVCDEIGVKVDGDLDMTVSAIQGGGTFDGTAPFDITLDTMFGALRALDGTEYYYADGDMQERLADDGAGNIGARITGSSLDTSYNSQYPNVATYHDQKVSGYTFNVSGNENSGVYAIDLDGMVESRDIDGTVGFTTTDTTKDPTVTAFTGNEFVGNGDPMAGVVLIWSDLPLPNGSQMKLIAQANGVDVELQVDKDNDDVFETTGLMWTWAQLEAL